MIVAVFLFSLGSQLLIYDQLVWQFCLVIDGFGLTCGNAWKSCYSLSGLLYAIELQWNSLMLAA